MTIEKINNYQISQLLEPKNKKAHWNIEKDECVLLIHDMQKYFLEPYNMSSEPYLTLINNIKKIKKICKGHSVPIIYSVQSEGQSVSQRGLLKDFWGIGIPKNMGKDEIVKELLPDENDIVITKWRYSAFESTKLENIIRKNNKSQLIIVGVYTHIGCLATATDAFMKNIKPFLIFDATADFSYKKHKLALDYVSNLTGMVLSTDNAIRDINCSQ